MSNLKSFLVIGYGSQLRGDDGIGQAVAMQVEQWNIPNLRSHSLHQLTPELAEELATVDYAIFVDACIEGNSVEILPLEPLPEASFKWGHHLNPRSLLSMTQLLYQKVPQAWLVSVSGENFELCDRLSEIAEKRVQETLTKIEELISVRSQH